MDQGRVLFTVLVVLFLGWFALFTQLNIRRGNAVLRWLQDGLSLVGQKTTLRWLGSSAVELKVQEAIEPLRWVQVFVVLEPRDIPFLWGFFRARGRRELLIVRGQLHAMPRFELEALDVRAWSTREVVRDVKQQDWTVLETPPGVSLAAYARGGTQAAADLLRDYLRGDTPPELPLIRLAVRQEMPNLEIHWRLSGFEARSSRRIVESLQRVAKRVQEQAVEKRSLS